MSIPPPTGPPWDGLAAWRGSTDGSIITGGGVGV